jgi:hypothetical protein
MLVEFLKFFHFYMYSCTLFGLSPHTPSRQNLFHTLVLWYCWRENIRNNKKDIAFLLGWGKDSYAERYLALFPGIYAWQPTFVQTSSLLSSPLPIVASATLFTSPELGHQLHQILGFFPFHYSFCACSHLSVWTVSNNITAFVLDL